MGRRTGVVFLCVVVLLMLGVSGTARGGTERLSAYLVHLMESNDDSRRGVVSPDGRYVAFLSLADNLVLAGDSNGVQDVFVHDRTTGQITRVSVDSAGIEADGESWDPAISADGRYVAFRSAADNLAPGDINGSDDVFVHDRVTGQTTLVSVDSAGIQGNLGSFESAISADGRYVAFTSWADNLVVGDTNGAWDVFVHDRTTGQTTRVSVDSAGVQGNHASWNPAISADGRYVAFSSSADDLVPGDSNGVRDVFLHDRTTGQTTRVSVDSAGIQGDDESWGPAVSADARYVAFVSEADNLVPGDANGVADVFVRDRTTGQTLLVSVDSAGIQGNLGSFLPAISADGRYVAFSSHADNLVPGDANGVDDVFVHDRTTGQTTRVSVDSSSTEGDLQSTFNRSISADGRYVAFASDADNLVPGDTNGVQDVFVHDRTTGQTTRVSEYLTLVEGNSDSYVPAVSFDGRCVAFGSDADNLVAGDAYGWGDVFVHDRATGTITRVSVDSAGIQGDWNSGGPTAISADGSLVAFWSAASNLVGGDNNGKIDVFVHDRTTGGTTRVSVSSAGIEGNGTSSYPAVSADNRWVAFHSDADNLVGGDSNGVTDVFVHDRDTGQTFRVSVDSDGVEGNSFSRLPSISGDGQLIAFESYATNLVLNDTNGRRDIFVHDQTTGETARVSVDSAGTQANHDSANASISEDGRYVAFESSASNLVPNDTNGVGDVFVHDLVTGQTTRASVDSSGLQAYADCSTPSIAKDGLYVAFASSANSLVSDDTNSAWDVFVHDLTTGQTARVSLDSLGVEGNDNSRYPAVSADGRYITFDSDADNLVPNDTNASTDVFIVENAPAMPCEGVLLDITDRTYHSGEVVVCRAYVSLSAGPAVEVSDGADVTYSAPTIALRPGFRVLEDGTFRAGYDPLATPTSFLLRGSAAALSAGTMARRKPTARDPSEQRIANSPARRIGLAELPHDLLDVLKARGGDPAALHHMLTDGDGDLVVFVSDRDILDEDANELSDVYAYETATGQLTLVSHTPWGSAGNGASAYPAMDGLGDRIVFQSDASDLVESDLNGVTDIFLFDTAARSLARITEFYLFEDGLESPSAHPSIDAEGATVVFDRVDERGYRQIHGYEFDWPSAQTLSLREDGAGLRTDNHHPAISADGRYIAYVETTQSDTGNECHVHFYDRQTGVFERVACPDELRAAREETAPYFADDAGQVEWYLRGWHEPVITRNPLVH